MFGGQQEDNLLNGYESNNSISGEMYYQCKNWREWRLMWVGVIIALVLGYFVGMCLSRMLRGERFTGPSDYNLRNTGAGTGLYFDVVRPFDSRPRDDDCAQKSMNGNGMNGNGNGMNGNGNGMNGNGMNDNGMNGNGMNGMSHHKKMNNKKKKM